jgi:hypothetical protein
MADSTEQEKTEATETEFECRLDLCCLGCFLLGLLPHYS